MSQEIQTGAAAPEVTPEQQRAQIENFRDAVVKAAVDHKLSFDVVFNAVSQIAVSFMFDFLLLTDKELTDENVAATVGRFNEQTTQMSALGLKNMRDFVKAQQEEAERPKIITDLSQA